MANWINLLDVIYPIGSLYFSTKSTSPSSSIGGTWNQIKDKTLVGCGENFAAGSIGGEIEHTLTIDEMPRHQHYPSNRNFAITANATATAPSWGAKHAATNAGVTDFTGGGNRIPICRPTTQFISGKESLNIFYKKGRC